jgi:hypothetical protein
MRQIILLVAAVAAWSAEESSRTIEKTVPLGANGSLAVCGMNGPVRVTAGDGNDVRFTVRERISAPTRERLEELKKEVDFVSAAAGGGGRAVGGGPGVRTAGGAAPAALGVERGEGRA